MCRSFFVQPLGGFGDTGVQKNKSPLRTKKHNSIITVVIVLEKKRQRDDGDTCSEDSHWSYLAMQTHPAAIQGLFAEP